MATSFIDTFQNLAKSFSSDTNGFTWDDAIRKFQYAVAGITVGSLAIIETTQKMQCSVASQKLPEHYFVSSYCQESTWYRFSSVNSTTKSAYDNRWRYFQWYILIPPLMTVIFSLLYSSVVNGFLVPALRTASNIMNMWDEIKDDSITMEGASAINTTILNMAIRTRMFSETNMHYRKHSKHINDVISEDVVIDDDGNIIRSVRFYQDSLVVQPKDRMGHNTCLYYHFYLLLCILINGVAVVFMNKHFFMFPSAIACYYRKEDLSFHWSICSVPGYRYFRVARLIIMLNHVAGVLVALLSLIYLNVFIPKQILKADAAISSYTRNPKQQEKLLQCWRNYGKEKLKGLTSTTKFLLALIYQNLDRTLYYRIVLAMVDIEKDRDAIKFDLPRLIAEIVEIEKEHLGVTNEDKEDKVNEIRETIMNPVGIDQVKENIRNNVLINLLCTYLDNPDSLSALLQAQQVHRITGVQLPKMSRDMINKFISLIHEKKESDFDSGVTYSRFLSAVYDISKAKQFFTLLQPIEIGQLPESENIDFVCDNGHEVVGGKHFDGQKAFDMSGYCWRSSDATAYNWIKRTWEREYEIKLIAIQGSHVNRKSTPIRFNFTAEVETDKSGEIGWVAVSETYRSYDWLNDEWRVYPVVTMDKENGTAIHPRTKCLQINIFDNGGAKFFEIQKIKIFGSH